MKKITKLMLPLVVVCFLAACGSEETPKTEEPVNKVKEEQKTNTSEKSSSKEREVGAKEEKTDEVINELVEEEIDSVNLNKVIGKTVQKNKEQKQVKKEETKKTTLTKQQQAKEYQKLLNTYEKGKEKLVPSLTELNKLTLEAKANNNVFTREQEKRRDDEIAKLLKISKEEINTLRNRKFDENLPENMKKAMRSVQLDLIKDYELVIETVKIMQKVSNNPYYDAQPDMQRIANDILELGSNLRAKNKKMEEHFGIDTGLEW